MRSLPVALLVAVLAQAPAPPALTRPPRVVEAAEPTYPPEALAQGLSAEVVLELDVSASGEVSDARVVQPAGGGFDEAALEAVRRFRFEPAELDGQPAAVTIEYRLRFEPPPPPAPREGAAPPPDAPSPPPAAATTVRVRGRVQVLGTQDPVAGAAVEASSGAVVESATTDAGGRFELPPLPPGEAKLVVVAAGYLRLEAVEPLAAGGEVELLYRLRPEHEEGLVSYVHGQRERRDVSRVAVSAKEVTRIAGISGDTVKVVQNLPGVARVDTFSGLLVVRGGSASDTRVYVDGLEVPLVFHFGGLSSVYSSELLEDVEFEPGNFGVRYGRATGGRVELVSRTPRTDRLHLVADVDLYDGTALAEGPLGEAAAGAIALRRSWVDGVLVAALQAAPPGLDAPGFAVAPRYVDGQTMVELRPGPADVVRLSAFGSNDRLALVSLDDDSVDGIDAVELETSFARLGVRWDHRLSPSTRTRVLVGPGWDNAGAFVGPLLFDFTIWSLAVRAEGSHDVSGALTVTAGLDTRLFQANATTRVPVPPGAGQLGPPSLGDRLVRADFDLFEAEPAVWLEAAIRPTPALLLVPGVRVDHELYLGETWVDPRLTARWAVDGATALKAGAGLYHQPPALQYGTEEFGNPDLGPEAAVQLGAGVERRLFGPLEVDVELYHKELADLVVPSQRIVTRDGLPVPERYANEGTGRAYGAELLVRWQPDGRLFGWLAYSLARTVRDQDSADDDLGPPPAESFDQRHNLVAVAMVELPELWDGLSAGARLRATSGRAESGVAGSIYDADSDSAILLPTPGATIQLPSFFQLDVRVDKRVRFESSVLAFYADVQNVTNRENAEGVFWSWDGTQRAWVPGLPIFPSIGVRWER